MSFTKKVVVITGAASGVGTAIALGFAKLNATLCIIDKNEKGLLKTKRNCEELTKGKLLEIVADLTEDKEIKKIIETAVKELGKINVLVNCAGILGSGSLQDPDIVKRFDDAIAINLRSMVVMTKEALPALIESKGCIINISSVASTKMMANMLAYRISKAGVTSFTKCTAFELASRGVRVNCISPGPVRTNIWSNAGVSEAEQDAIWDSLAGKMPLKMCVKGEEVAELAVYLAGDKAASITGSDFVVDAGMMIGV
ncbi:dehydrogenase/reductase SDR family member 6-like [Epargyreus clarus]|uniref:dehydrogenase/reductase SDR family member 6-like n=1 Tax=Epargyreus clarus TaxID=520877 RepID=UPI003C30AFC7